MKRVFAMFLVFSLFLTFTSCSSDAPSSGNSPTMQEDPSQSVSTGSTEDSTTVPAPEPSPEVTVTIPSLFYEGTDLSAFDPEQYASENGFISAVVNEDQSVTIVMTAAKQEELLCELTKTLDEYFTQYIGSEDTPHIENITHSENYDTITVFVDRSEYEHASGLATLSLVIYAIMYQSFAGLEYRIEIITVDAANGDILDSQLYPIS